MNWNYVQPVAVHFGNGTIQELGREIEALGGSRGLLITSPSFHKRGMTEKIMTDSKGKLVCLYYRVSPNPDVTECAVCVDMLRENHCDFVVALGGGSVLDCAKAAAAMATADKPVSAYMEKGAAMPAQSLPLIAVPTTAGTGSEITCVSVLSDHEKGIKAPLSCDAFYPKVAIVDPELTYSVPQHITACTGMDVLCHALEAYWSKHHQPVCDALAVHALQLVLENLRTVCKEPQNGVAREKMAEASVIAGMAFTIPKTTSAHACSYPLTNLLGIAHGEACALTIDYFLHINGAHDDGRLQQLAASLGFASVDQLEAEIVSLKRDIGMMADLTAFSIDDDMFNKLVQGSKHPNLLNNPVEITEEMLLDLYNKLR